MTASSGFLDLVKDQLSGFGPVTIRRMFGGAGVFIDGLMFGLIADDVLYLKVDAENAAAFTAEGLQPFTYAARGRRTEMSYRRAPERLLDDPEEMREWADSALAAARRASLRKQTGSRKKAARKVAAKKKA